MSEAVTGPLEIGDSILYQKVGEEIVLLNIASQEYFGLDNVGSDVWQLLMEHRDVAAVAKRLAALYSVDEQTVRSDIEPMISDLVAAKLLKTTLSSENPQV